MGTTQFCPVVRRTPDLTALLEWNITNAITQLKENYSTPLMKIARYIKKDNEEIQVTNPLVIEGYFRYPDLTTQSIFLARTILATISNDMPNELLFIQRYDELKKVVQYIVDMPDKDINQMIIFFTSKQRSILKTKTE